MNPETLRVLLAEDDAAIAADLEACLREAGHEVVGVEARGDATLTATRLLQPDVVLLNVHLRGPLDGPAVATVLRGHSPSPIPVVFFTAWAEDPAAQHLSAVVPVAALARPILAQHLQRALASVLGY